MKYLSSKEAADKWGISDRRVQILCNEERIPGVIRIGSIWGIPEDAEKPKDQRIKSGKYVKNMAEKNSDLKTIHVAAAIIYKGDRIFATQRGYGSWKDYWEFPGGKIEQGETPEEALRREIREELDTEITVGEKFTTIEYDYPEFHLSMDCFFAVVTGGSLVLKEHEAARWLRKDELDSINWLPADQTIIEMLKELIFEGKTIYER